MKYQTLTTDLLRLNESLGLEDADVQEQLNAIRKKNEKLTRVGIKYLETPYPPANK